MLLDELNSVPVEVLDERDNFVGVAFHRSGLRTISRPRSPATGILV